MKVIFDITNIIPGNGGAGGGIWVYASRLLAELDLMAATKSFEVICLKNSKNQNLELSNIRIIDIELNSKSLIHRMYWLHVRLPRLCKKFNADLLHRVVPEMPMFNYCKSVCTLHDLMFNFYLSNKDMNRSLSFMDRAKFQVLNIKTKMAVNNSDAVIVPSYSVEREVNEVFKGGSTKLIVIPEASDRSHRPSPEPNNFTRGDIFRIIVVAGFYPHKGHFNVINLAMEMVKNGIYNFEITFRGNSTNTEFIQELKDKIAENNLQSFFVFSSFNNKHDLKDIYKGQHCFLLLSEYEGFGLPLLEAQSFGLPVVCSDIPVFKENLGDSALFVNPFDSKQLFSIIIKLMVSPSLRTELVEKGHKNVQRFSWEKMSNDTLRVYESINLS